jgi:hypothetical protein
MSELGKKWKVISEEEREKYQELAKVDKERYQEEMKNYVPDEDDEDGGEKKKRKRKSKNSPKNASGPYIFFCKEERENIKKENPDMLSKDIMTELGKRWKLIKDTDEVLKYQELAKEDKERYEEEMKNYIPSDDNEEPKQKKQRVKKDKNAPKNPTTMYQIFCKEKREELKKNKDIPAKEITKKLGEIWKTFKDDKKNQKIMEKWQTMIEKDKVRFEKEMEEYKLRKENAMDIEDDDDEDHNMSDKEEDSEDNSIDKVVKNIIDNYRGENITKRIIKEELKKKNIELSKDELNEVIQRVQN